MSNSPEQEGWTYHYGVEQIGDLLYVFRYIDSRVETSKYVLFSASTHEEALAMAPLLSLEMAVPLAPQTLAALAEVSDE